MTNKGLVATMVLLTFMLVLVGCILYVLDYIGWAQFLFVLASGSAGAAILSILEDKG